MTDVTAPVSVLIPCYCCRETIARALHSVLNQTMRPREILLVDDASPDDGATVRELQRLAGQYANTVPIKVILSPRNGGPGSARNQGWEQADQPFVAFLDADDAWLPRKIEIQYAWMRDHPAYGLSCHLHGLADADAWPATQPAGVAGTVAAREILGASLLWSNAIATRTVMLRRDVPFRFQEGKRYAEDYLLWLELLLGGLQAARIESCLAVAFKGDFGAGGLSANLLRMERGELDCYGRLYRSGRLGLPTLIACSLFSLARFFRRVLMVALRRAL